MVHPHEYEIRFAQAQVLTSEIPDEVSLGIFCTGCPQHCKGCHSQDLWDEEKGEVLFLFRLRMLINSQKGITCVLFMGGDWQPDALLRHLMMVKKEFNLNTALYTGKNIYELAGMDNYVFEDMIQNLNYLKVGAYVQELGGLEKTTTNQRLYRIERPYYTFVDITNKFWSKP